MGRRIEFSFVGDTADLERSLRAVASEGREAGDQVESGGKRGAAGLGKAEKASKALKAGLVAVAAGAAAAAAGTAAVVKAAIDFGARADTIAKKAKAIGTSAEELQLLTGALELGGVNAETTAASIQKLQVNLGLAAKGGKLQVDALNALKLSSEQLESVPLEERMALIADGLGNMTSQSKRAQTAQALLGRGALDMLAAFTDGGDAIRNNTDLIREAGIISNETAAEGEALTDAVALLSRQVGAFRDEALAPMLPILTQTADGIRGALAEVDPGVFVAVGDAAGRAFLEVIAPAAIELGRMMAKAFAGAKATLAGFKLAIVGLETALLQIPRAIGAAALAISGDFEGARELMTRGVKKTIAAVGEFEDAAYNSASAIAGVDMVVDGLKESLAKVAANLGKATEQSTEASDAISEVGEAASDAADEVKGLGKEVKSVGQDIEDFFGEFNVSAIEGVFPSPEEARKNAEERFQIEHALHTAIQAQNEERRQQRAADAQEAIDAAHQVADSTLQIMQQAAAAELDARVSAAQKTKDEIADLEEQITNAATEGERRKLEAQKAALIARRSEEKRDALEAFRVSQAVAVTQALVSTALAVISQLAGLPGPAGIAASVAAGITGAAQVAAIASQPPPQFHSGGMIGANVHDEITIRARAGEAVLSPQGVAAAGGARGVNALNAGGGGGGQNVTVFQVGHRVLDSMVHASLRRPAGRLTRELRSVRPRRVGRYNPHRS